MKDEYRPFLDAIESAPDGDRDGMWLVFADYLADRGDELERGVREMVASGWRPVRILSEWREQWTWVFFVDSDDYTMFHQWAKEGRVDIEPATLPESVFRRIEPNEIYASTGSDSYLDAMLSLATSLTESLVRPTPST
jgi:uncharacterized protein (TIGR02996 family)